MSEQSNVKYNKIVMLVHPGYYVTFDIVDKDLDNPKALSLDLRKILKTFFGAYGRALLDAKEDPKTLFVIVKPNFWDGRNDAIFMYFHFRFYTILFDRFFNFAKKQLGDRLVVTDYDPTVERSSKLLPDDYLSKINDKIFLESFGEYGRACVGYWRNYMRDFLTKRNIRVISSRTNLKYSYVGAKKENLDEDALDVRLMKQARERRRQRRRLESPVKMPRIKG